MKRLPIYLAVGLLACSCTCSKKEPKPKMRFEWFGCRTNDRMYLDSTLYLMNKSPLSDFPDYIKIFKHKGEVLNNMVSFTDGYPEKFYSAQWVILGDSLYLYAVDYDWSQDLIPDPTIDLFKTTEKLTGRKFTYHPGNKGLPYKTYGVIPANWFSGAIQVKMPIDPGNSPLGDEIYWRDLPFQVLTFEKGKLISKRQSNKYD